MTVDTAPMTDQQLAYAIAAAKAGYEQLPIGPERFNAWTRYTDLVEEQMRRKGRKAA